MTLRAAGSSASDVVEGGRSASAAIASLTENTVVHCLQRNRAVGRAASLSSVIRYFASHLGQWNLISGRWIRMWGSTPVGRRNRHQKSRSRWLRMASRVFSSGAKANARSHISVDLF